MNIPKSIILLYAVLTFSTCIAGPSKKYERYRKRADRYFSNFVYPKAVRLYEKASEESDEPDVYSYLKIADSYRLMNNSLSSEHWYQRVEGSSIMEEQDYMNYAQVLLKNGQNEKALQIYTSIKNSKSVSIGRLESMNDMERYYTDSLAFFIENMDINSTESDFSPTYYQNGFVFVSNRKNKKISQSTYYWDDSYFLDLYYTEVSDDGNIQPVAMPKGINTIFHEGPADFYDQYNKIIFTRNNFNLGEERTSEEGVNKLKLYYSERITENSKWSKPIELPFASDEYSVGHPSLTEDGETIYFASDMFGTHGKADIYRARYVDGKWENPENLGDVINTTEDEFFPYISKTNVLYFSSLGHHGIGGLDIYSVDLNVLPYEVKNMGYPINTKDDDFGIIMEGNVGYFSSNRLGSKGADDIYKVIMYAYDMGVRLVNEETRETVKGNIVVRSKETGESVLNITNNVFGSFYTLRGKEYVISGSSEGFQEQVVDFSTLLIPLDSVYFVLDLPLKKLELSHDKGDIIVVNNYGKTEQIVGAMGSIRLFNGTIEEQKIEFEKKRYVIENIYQIHSVYYDFDRYNIREDAAVTLNLLIEVLTKYTDLTVSLGSHTDNRGANAYNDQLAHKRAESARQYLIDAGIEKERISIKHYGETQLVNTCQDTCLESEHQLNRRTEITLSH